MRLGINDVILLQMNNELCTNTRYKSKIWARVLEIYRI